MRPMRRRLTLGPYVKQATVLGDGVTLGNYDATLGNGVTLGDGVKLADGVTARATT